MSGPVPVLGPDRLKDRTDSSPLHSGRKKTDNDHIDKDIRSSEVPTSALK